MAPDPTETKAFDVFLEYHLTSMLLSLVVTIAGQDHPQNLLSGYEPPLEYSPRLSSRRRALNAFANILVRNVEAAAVTTSGPSPHPGGGSTSSDAPNTLQVLVMQEENNSTSLPSTETVVPNSQLSDPPTTPVQEPWITTIAPGQSKFAEIMASPWSCVTKPNEILPLSDHLATIEQHLNEYQLRTQPTEPKSNDQSTGKQVEGEDSKSKSDPDRIRANQIDNFFTYLVSTCYPKVRRQLSNRLSKKLLSFLSSITGPQLEHQSEAESLKDPESLKMSDLHLCKVVYLAQSDENDPYDFQAMVQELKDKHYQRSETLDLSPAEEPPGTPSPQKASPLFEALTQTFESIKSKTLDQSGLPILYTKETYVDFHYFLLVALNKYSDAVNQFYDHAMDGSVTEEDRRNLSLYSSLLWRIAHSSFLSNHLKLICKLMPQNFMCSDLAANGVQHEHEGTLEDEDAYPSDGGVKEEMAAIEGDPSHRSDPALMIQRWISLLVSHLQAHQLLLSFASSSPPTVVRIQHVTVKTTKFETPQDWTAVLKRALHREGPRLLAQYNRLEELILMKINEGAGGHKGIFRYFKGKDIISGCGQVHCEAGLAAALHSPPQDTVILEQYHDGFGNRKKDMTASRLCCPLCWELLGRLRPLQRFGIQGRSHSGLTPVKLPGWVRRAIAEDLLELLRDRLNEELSSLLKKSSEDKRRTALSTVPSSTDEILLDLATLFNLEVSFHIPCPVSD